MSRLVDHVRRQPLGALALALVLTGGTAYAVDKLPKDSVSSKQIKNSSVKGVDVKDRSLSGADLRDGSVTGTDLTDGSVTGADLAAGAVPLGVQVATASDTDSSPAATATAVPLPGGSVQITLPKGGTIVASFTAEAFCANQQVAPAYCNINMAVDGMLMDGEKDVDAEVFEASDAEGNDVFGSRTVVRSMEVGPGTHTVAPYYYVEVSSGVGIYTLSDWTLVATGYPNP
jgi:hypothetical protein